MEKGNWEETTTMLWPVSLLQRGQTLEEWVPPSQRDIWRVKEVQSIQQRKVSARASHLKPYWPGWSWIRVGRTKLPDPGPPGAHGHHESRGPRINHFYGAYQSWTLHGNHRVVTCGSLHRLNSSYCWGHRGYGSPLILQGPFVSARGPAHDS